MLVFLNNLFTEIPHKQISIMKLESNKISFLVLGIFILILKNIHAQDVHFSQYRETPIFVNPGQTGLTKDLRFILNYKDQWRSFVSPYKTFAFSGDIKATKYKKKENYLGVGFQLFSDKAGDSQMGTVQGSLNLSGIIKTSKHSKLGLGIMGGIGQHTVNYSKLQWESQYVGSTFDPNSPTGEVQGSTSYIYPDLGAGIAWTYGKEEIYISANNGVHGTVGISAFHFGLPKYSFYNQTNEKLNTKMVAHGNIEFGIMNSNLLIAPELYYFRQGAQQEIVFGSVFKYIMQEASKYTLIKKASAVSIGADYRVGDALIASLLYEYSSYAIGISYDLNMSPLYKASSFKGGIEVSIRFVTPNPFNPTRASFK